MEMSKTVKQSLPTSESFADIGKLGTSYFVSEIGLGKFFA
jgi:hypothetical protein